MKGFLELSVLTGRDVRGWVGNLPDFYPEFPDNLNHVHIVSMEPGAIRGNHYHRVQTEAVCVLGANIQVMAFKKDTGERHEQVTGDDTPSLFVISPNVTHAFFNPSNQAGHLVCFADQLFDPENPDVVTDIIFEKEPKNAP